MSLRERLFARRQALGETVTAWLKDAKDHRPGFQLVDAVVRQSSDEAYHCISICLFYNENQLPVGKPLRS